jgi:hypothetical protein
MPSNFQFSADNGYSTDQNTNTEFKLYTIGHYLKRIYNEIKEKTTKNKKNYKKIKNTKFN